MTEFDNIAAGERAVAAKHYLEKHIESRRSLVINRAVSLLEAGTLTPEVAIATIGALRELVQLQRKLETDIRTGQKVMEATVASDSAN